MTRRFCLVSTSLAPISQPWSTHRSVSVRSEKDWPSSVDWFVHVWDIAYPLGITVEIPPDLVKFAYQHLDAIAREQLRSPQLFRQPVEPSADASESDRFLAWTGRCLR